MRFLRQVMVITTKDLRAEVRTKEAINASIAFAIVILLILSFAFDPSEDTTREISGGLLWIVFTFAGTLVLNRSFARELPNDCLDGLLAAPVPGSAIFLGKALSNFVLILAVEAVALPVFGIFYNVRWTRQFWPLMGGTLGWGLTAIGTVFRRSLSTSGAQVMLPVLVYPLMIPMLLGAMLLTAQLVMGQPIAEIPSFGCACCSGSTSSSRLSRWC
jgi:heme exporter protein B